MLRCVVQLEAFEKCYCVLSINIEVTRTVGHGSGWGREETWPCATEKSFSFSYRKVWLPALATVLRSLALANLTWSRNPAGEGSVKANWKEDAWVIREVCGEKISLQSSDETRCCCVGCGESVNVQLWRGQAWLFKDISACLICLGLICSCSVLPLIASSDKYL